MTRSLVINFTLITLFIFVASATSETSETFSQPNQNCNITHFDFQNNISLGNNDELNKTFINLGEKINSLNNVSWKANDSVTYTITNANPTFYYRSSKQIAEIVGNDTILIKGGSAEVTINFKWQKTGSNPKSGTATVFGVSDEIAFAKDIIIDGDNFRYELQDYRNVTFDTPINLTRIDPPVSDDEKSDLLKLVNFINDVSGVITVKQELKNDIALYFSFYLKANLYAENTPIERKFFYRWVNPVASKGDLVVNFTRRPVFIDIERDGIHYGYEAAIYNFTESKCGQMPPTLPLDPSVYGGSQQFISYGFYQNLIRYAIKNGQFDTNLNRDGWESRMFQFYAGDLYDIFPKVAETFTASTDVTGNCKANSSQIKVYKADKNTFNVTFREVCQLNINKTKIIELSVGLELEIQGRPTSDWIDFYLKSHTEFVSYFDTFGYKLQNKPLADAMIRHSLNRLYQTKLFGSGWSLSPQRDYPHFETQPKASLVFDSSHVKW